MNDSLTNTVVEKKTVFGKSIYIYFLVGIFYIFYGTYICSAWVERGL